MSLLQTLFLVIFSTSLIANDSALDFELNQLIKKNGLSALDHSQAENSELVKLGFEIFREKEISGTREHSCMTCHHPEKGTSDGHPLALGLGNSGEGQLRQHQQNGIILRRNSPALFNLAYQNVTDLFWDGRVSLHHNVYNTPAGLLDPSIANNLTGALSAQVLFPMASADEMRGHDSNEIALATDANDIWKLITKRITSIPNYRVKLSNIFKQTPIEQINIGHLAQALSAFIGETFQANNTPYDQYLRGDLNALTLAQKRGFKIFMTKGNCVLCHNGPHLSNFEYRSVGAPQLVINNKFDDTGRFEVSGTKRDLYTFRTPPLRNIAHSVPYTHSGSLATIESVVEHYNDIEASLRDYQVSNYLQHFYAVPIQVDKDIFRNKVRFQNLTITQFKVGLKLSSTEKSDLVDFLRNGLTDSSYLERWDNLVNSP